MWRKVKMICWDIWSIQVLTHLKFWRIKKLQKLSKLHRWKVGKKERWKIQPQKNSNRCWVGHLKDGKELWQKRPWWQKIRTIWLKRRRFRNSVQNLKRLRIQKSLRNKNLSRSLNQRCKNAELALKCKSMMWKSFLEIDFLQRKMTKMILIRG